MSDQKLLPMPDGSFDIVLPVVFEGKVKHTVIDSTPELAFDVYEHKKKFPSLTVAFLRRNYAPAFAGKKVKVTIEVLE